MKSRYLIHLLNHGALVIDISTIGLRNRIYPSDGEQQVLPSRRFQTWRAAQDFLLKSGVPLELLNKINDKLKSSNVAVLTVPEFYRET